MVTALWPKPIPIIGGTGPKWSGKTMFGATICPGPQTLVYDFEQSSASYDFIGFERIDVQKEMQKWCAERKLLGYKPIQLWEWFLGHLRSLPANKYRVIMADPITDVERGLTDWVFANPAAFGHTHEQYSRMSGVAWGDVKDFEKMVLADITAKCETFYFTAHVGREWGDDKKPTKNLKSKGKETLFELASLYLWFERNPNAKGEMPEIPSAKVLKSRLSVGSIQDGEVLTTSVLPPRLPKATPKAIRYYFDHPAGRSVLSADELAPEERLSDDDRLILETRKAEAEAIAVQAHGTSAATQAITTPEPVPVSPSPAPEPTAVPSPSTNGHKPISSAPTEPLGIGESVEGRAPASDTFKRNFETDIAKATDMTALKKVGEDIGAATRKGWISKEHREALNLVYAARAKELKGGAVPK